MIKDYSQDYISKSKIRKDYQKKQFDNPYFSKKRGVGSFNTWLYIKIIAILFFVYLVFYSSLLSIKNINIYGNDMIRSEELMQTVQQDLNSHRFYLLPQRNMIFFSKNRLAKKINNTYKLNYLEIKRKWNGLEIIVEEKISYLIVFNKERFYFIDSDGFVTQEIPIETIGDYWNKFPILNVGEIEINIGDQITNNKIIEFVLELNQKIKDTQLNIEGYEKGGEGEIVFVAKEGWRAYFDINNEIDLALENLILVLNEKIENQGSLEYIDLRFGSKVFYK